MSSNDSISSEINNSKQLLFNNVHIEEINLNGTNTNYYYYNNYNIQQQELNQQQNKLQSYGDNLLSNSQNQIEKKIYKSYFDALPPEYEITLNGENTTFLESEDCFYTSNSSSSLAESNSIITSCAEYNKIIKDSSKDEFSSNSYNNSKYVYAYEKKYCLTKTFD